MSKITEGKLRKSKETYSAPAGHWHVSVMGASLLIHRRSTWFFACFVTLLVVFIICSIPVGSTTLSIKKAFWAVWGQGSRGDLLIVQRLRMPRILAAILCGAALGGAGCLVQTMAKNRLATPEVLGQDAGASFAMTVFIMASAAQLLGPWWLASLGALCAGVILLLLAGGIGMNGYRVLIVGIGLTALMRSLTELLMSKTDLEHASVIYAWTLGSLEGQRYDLSVPAMIILMVFLPLVLLAGKRLSLLQFSENVSTTLGLNTSRVRLLVFFMAILLASLAVGVGGPIPFVALAAPIIASRFTGPNTVPVINSSVLGALLVLLADTVGRTVATPGEIPAGVLTSLLGGPFLLWVLLTDKR